MVNVEDEFKDFADTAEAIQNLEPVISVDSRSNSGCSLEKTERSTHSILCIIRRY